MKQGPGIDKLCGIPSIFRRVGVAQMHLPMWQVPDEVWQRTGSKQGTNANTCSNVTGYWVRQTATVNLKPSVRKLHACSTCLQTFTKSKGALPGQKLKNDMPRTSHRPHYTLAPCPRLCAWFRLDDTTGEASHGTSQSYLPHWLFQDSFSSIERLCPFADVAPIKKANLVWRRRTSEMPSAMLNYSSRSVGVLAASNCRQAIQSSTTQKVCRQAGK